jgi:sirohydrochlorin cobaltochelatase
MIEGLPCLISLFVKHPFFESHFTMILRFFKTLCILATASLGTSMLPAQTPIDRDGLLIVAFGTSHQKALTSYTSTEKTLTTCFPADKTSWAYTSDIIRHKIAKEGRPVPSIQESLKMLSDKGVKTLCVQSLHMAAGEEFSQMERTIQRYLEHNPGAFEKVLIGRPLLESNRDMQEVVTAILTEFPQERKADEAIVLMGHGQKEGRADLVFAAVQTELHRKDPKAFLATVEGTTGFDSILAELKKLQKQGLKTVWLAPFMIVAGDHATNDLAGDEEDSWASVLKKEGFEVKLNLKGLGELQGIRNVFLRHARETTDNILVVKKGMKE